MSRLHYIAKSINVLNCLLAIGAAAALSYVALTPEVETRKTLPALLRAAPKPTNLPPALPNPSFADYLLVSEKNLFHPERKIPLEKMDVVETAVAPKPDLVLYGTLIAGNMSIAYIEDRRAPYSTPGRERRQTQLKKGDNVGGYVLREIEPTRIVLVKGEERLVVLLDVKDRKRGGETTAGAPARAFSPPSVAPPPPPAANYPSPARSGVIRAPLPAPVLRRPR